MPPAHALAPSLTLNTPSTLGGGQTLRRHNKGNLTYPSFASRTNNSLVTSSCGPNMPYPLTITRGPSPLTLASASPASHLPVATRRSLRRTTRFHNAAEMKAQLAVVRAEAKRQATNNDHYKSSGGDDEGEGEEDVYFFAGDDSGSEPGSDCSVGCDGEDGFSASSLATATVMVVDADSEGTEDDSFVEESSFAQFCVGVEEVDMCKPKSHHIPSLTDDLDFDSSGILAFASSPQPKRLLGHGGQPKRSSVYPSRLGVLASDAYAGEGDLSVLSVMSESSVGGASFSLIEDSFGY